MFTVLKNKPQRRIWAVLLAFVMVFALLAPGNTARAGKVKADTEPDGPIKVIISLKMPCLIDAGFDPSAVATDPEASAYLDDLALYQTNAAELIGAALGEKADVTGSLTVLDDALALTMAADKLDAVKALDCVREVLVLGATGGTNPDKGGVRNEATSNAEPKEENPEKLTATAGEMVEKDYAWSNGYTGAGMRIAIIDDGFEVDHPSFAEDAFLYSLEKTATEAGKTIEDYDLLDESEIKMVLKHLHVYERLEDVKAGDLYRTAKIPFGFNYGSNSLELFDEFSSGHGIHVAGIAAANKYVDTDGKFKAQALGVAGVAPDAQIIAMHTFCSNGTYDTDYMEALEDALLLGADSINLSLGGAALGYADALSFGDYAVELMDKLTETDTVVAMSAGNSSSWSANELNGYGVNRADEVNFATVEDPGTLAGSLSVASNHNTGEIGTPLIINNSLKVLRQSARYGNDDIFPGLSSLEGAEDGKEFEYVYINGLGYPEDFEAVDVTGKIAFVDRGEITFAEKHAAAVSAGAIGLVICNNSSAGVICNLGESSGTVPCESISLFDALAVKECSEYDEATGTYHGTLTISDEQIIGTTTDGYEPSDFSSWGVPEDLSLKPEIMAPGDYIYSSYKNGDYASLQGTSMAAPMISGSSALIIQYIEENGLAEKTGLTKRALAQSLLMGTAIPVTKPDGTAYSPRKQGAGLANLQAALNTPAYILVGNREGNDGKVKAELHDDPDRKGIYSFSFTVNNLSDEPLYYALDSSVLTEALTADDAGQLFSLGDSVELSPKVTFGSDDKILLSYDFDGNGKVNRKDAKAFKASLKKTNKSDYALLVRNCPNDYDLNRDGVVNKKDVTLFKKAVKNPSKSNIDLARQTLIVSGSEAEVSVRIALSQDDRGYLEYFPNGMFVDGYIELNGKVGLSIPFLAFYGNWSDSSMYEPFDYIEYRHGALNWWIYTLEAPKVTNYFLMFSQARKDEFKYASNPFVTDDTYLPERNAFSSTSGDVLEELDVTFIRNARYITAKIENAETGDIYFEDNGEFWYGAFYDYDSGKWKVTQERIVFGWKGTDADGNPLPEGTKVLVSLKSVPEYYSSIDEATGRGTTIELPLTIDNTAPTAKRGKKGTRTDKKGQTHETLTVKVKDENYVAAVVVYDADKKTVIKRYAVNQLKPGVTKKVVIDKPDSDCYVAVYDYAGNETGFELKK